MLAPQSVAMVFADLPYGRVTQCDWDFRLNLASFWPAVWQVCLPAATVCATSVQPFTTALINSQAQAFKYTMVWDKKFSGAFAAARFRPLTVHEDICVFARQRGIYNPQMTKRDKPIKLGANKCASQSASGRPIVANQKHAGKIYTHKHPTTLLSFSNRADKRGLHPTQKPVALLEWLVATYTNPGDTVLDPAMGSGGSGVACARLGRNFIGIEKDKTYFDIAQKRITEERRSLGLP